MSLINKCAVALNVGSESNHVSAAIIGNIIINPITIITIFFCISYFNTYPTFRFYDDNTFLGQFYFLLFQINSLYFCWSYACFTGSTLCLFNGGNDCNYFYIFWTMLENGISFIVIFKLYERLNFYFSYLFFAISNIYFLFINDNLLELRLVRFVFDSGWCQWGSLVEKGCYGFKR